MKTLQKQVMIIGVVVLLTVAMALSAAAATKKIVFYTPAWGVEVAEQLIELYKQEKPDIEIELIRGPSTWEDHVSRCSMWIRTKYNGVDVLYEDDVFTLDGAYTGVWEDLEPYLSQEQINDFTELQQEFIQVHEGIYRLPWWVGGFYIYYRKDIFEKEGLTPPKTWEEFLNVGKQLTKDLDGDGQIDQWGYVPVGEPGTIYNAFVQFLMQAGGDQWTFASQGQPDPKALQALQFMTEVYQTISPPDLTSLTNFDFTRAFLREGKAVMIPAWGDTGQIFAKEGLANIIDVMPAPAGPAGSYSIGASWGIVVNKHGKNFKKHQEDVIDFVKFMVRPEIHKITAEASEVPMLKSVLADQDYMQKLATKNLAIARIDELITTWKMRRFPPGHSVEFHDGIGRTVTKVILNQVSPEEGLIEMQQAIEPLLPQQ